MGQLITGGIVRTPGLPRGSVLLFIFPVAGSRWRGYAEDPAHLLLASRRHCVGTNETSAAR